MATQSQVSPQTRTTIASADLGADGLDGRPRDDRPVQPRDRRAVVVSCDEPRSEDDGDVPAREEINVQDASHRGSVGAKRSRARRAHRARYPAPRGRLGKWPPHGRIQP